MVYADISAIVVRYAAYEDRPPNCSAKIWLYFKRANELKARHKLL